MIDVSDIKVWPTSNTNGKIKANGSFLINEAVKVKYTIFSGPKGMFVSLPGRYGESKEGKKEWYADVLIINPEVQTQVQTQVLAAYNKKIGNAVHEAQEPHSQVVEDDGVPY